VTLAAIEGAGPAPAVLWFAVVTPVREADPWKCDASPGGNIDELRIRVVQDRAHRITGAVRKAELQLARRAGEPHVAEFVPEPARIAGNPEGRPPRREPQVREREAGFECTDSRRRFVRADPPPDLRVDGASAG